jgi:nucleotide-binding universal stress UspA family protein
MRQARQVLATLDQSKLSEAILPFLPAVLRFGDEVVLLSVAAPPRSVVSERQEITQPLMVGPRLEFLAQVEPAYIEDIDHAFQRLKSELTDYLEDRAIILRNEGFTVRTMVTIDAEPARGIINCARELGPLFIAMATHGRSGLGYAISGSVAEEVVRSRVAPVLLIRP